MGEGFSQSWGAHLELGLDRQSGGENAVLAWGVGNWKEHDSCGARRSQVELSRGCWERNLNILSAFAFLISPEGLEGSVARRGLIILLAISTQGSWSFFFRLIIDNANVIINI